MKKLLLILICIGVLTAVSYLALCPTCVVDDSQTNSFIVDRPYKEVIRSLARQDALEQIVAMSEGRIVGKEWDRLMLDVERIFTPVWQVNGQARFIVQLENPHAGQLNINLCQDIHATQNCMEIKVYSTNEAGIVKLVQNRLLVQAEGKQTKFTTINRLVVHYRAPRQYHPVVQQNVVAANANGVKNTEICLQRLSEQRGFSIPLNKPLTFSKK